MAEKQNIEWKAIWKDDYLAWLCGFANAQGGKLYIGVDDSGKPIGLSNCKNSLRIFQTKSVILWGLLQILICIQMKDKIILK